MNAALNYDALRDSLARSGFAGALSELHGNLCGVLCSGGELATQRWVSECVAEELPAAVPEAAGELRETLNEIAAATSRMLSGEELKFEPLLPDEDEPLEEQVRALGSYCDGFLSGLALGGTSAAASIESELHEILVDFSEISRVGLTADDREGADFALAELKEYVRVSVQLVYEQLASRSPGAQVAAVHEPAGDGEDYDA